MTESRPLPPHAHPGLSLLHLPALLHLAEQPGALDWQPFRTGVDIHRLYGDGLTGPSAALLRFQPGGRVPRHEHTGYEHIFVLTGSQEDENGLTAAGGLVINPPGTTHSILSADGCLVLAIYEKPVRFLADPLA